MLIELYGKNFGCFRDEFRLSMLATDIDPGSQRGIVEVNVERDNEPLRLLRAVALYGPNASGKSTLIRAAGALSRMLFFTSRLSSDSPLVHYEPFALGPRSGQPVELGAKAVIEGAVYDYSISFDSDIVCSEKLSRLSGEAPIVLFERVGPEVVGAWTKHPQFELVSRAFRPNALLLSLADALAPDVAKAIAVGFRRVLKQQTMRPEPHRDQSQRVAERVRNEPAFSAWLLGRLRSADVGVVDLLPHKIRYTVQGGRANKATGEKGEPRERIETFMKLVHGGHKRAVPLPYSRESLGTRSLVELAPLLYDLTHDRRARAVFVDEFDASIHPVLLGDLIRHFNCELPTKDVRGQLIFTTHETALMDDEAKDAVLRRDQVYFTEKDASGAARLFSLAEFKERNNLNIRRRYLQGRYGALPSLGTFGE